MTRNRWLFLIMGIVLILLLLWLIILWIEPGNPRTDFIELFDDEGTWTVGQDAVASGIVKDGRYEITVNEMGDIYWITAGENFDDGYYEVQANPIEGVIDNGYGMLIRVDQEKGRFYLFKISSDGYVFIGRCDMSCLETEVLVSQGWFSSPAVNQGLEITNTLGISAVGPEMTFFVNNSEVGRITDESLKSGDIGLLAETLGPGGIVVAFDNFKVTLVGNE